jgi:hypothetical protein
VFVGRGVCVAVAVCVEREAVVGSVVAGIAAVGELLLTGGGGGGVPPLPDERKTMMPLINNNSTVPTSSRVAGGVNPPGSRRKLRWRSRGSTLFRYAGW